MRVVIKLTMERGLDRGVSAHYGERGGVKWRFAGEGNG